MIIKATKNYKIIAFLLVIPLLILSSMIYVNAQSSSTRTEFSNYYDLPSCELDGSGWWLVSRFEATGPTGTNCYMAEVAEGSSNTCCPLQQNCSVSSGSVIGGRCEVALDIEFCSDYKSQSACQSYSDPVAINDIETKTWEDYCTDSEYDSITRCIRYNERCLCFWNSTNQSCQSSVNYTTECPEEDPVSVGKCTFMTKSKTNCTDNYRFIEWDASWSGDPAEKPAECIGGRKKIKCFSSELYFFGILGIIVVIVLIVIFYLIFNRKSRKNRTRKKSKK